MMGFQPGVLEVLNRRRLTATGGSLPGYTESYRYDEIGNITRRNGIAYTYDPQQPHAVTQVATNTYRYDDNGNMTDRTEGGVVYTQIWNFENKLDQVAWNGENVRFVYDGDGNRLLKIEQPLGSPQKTTLYLGQHYEVEVGSVMTPTKYYFHGDTRVAMRRDGEVYYLHGDHLGSTSLTTDQDGVKVSGAGYLPYGRKHWADGTPPTDFGFTAQRHEASFGLIDYNARYYSPLLGRFISPDTVVPQLANSQAWNRYTYVLNNPLKYTDPTGHQQEPWYEKLARSVQQLINDVQQQWYYRNPCTLSTSCSSVPLFQPAPSPGEAAKELTKDMMGPTLIDPAQVEQFKDILEIQDQAVRAAELAKAFEYKPPAEGGPGTYDYALQPHEDRAKSFAETYGIDLGNTDIHYDPNFRSGGDGLFKANGEEYNGKVLNQDTIILGPGAFDNDEILGTTLFHETLEQYRDDDMLTHSEIYELEKAWTEWFRSLDDQN